MSLSAELIILDYTATLFSAEDFRDDRKYAYLDMQD